MKVYSVIASNWIRLLFNMCSVCLMIVQDAKTQNFVLNPGFEENAETIKSNVTSITGGFQFITNWEVLAWQTFYCHCEIPHKNNWYFSTCRSHLYAPRTGCGMVKMVYEESCDSDNITGTGERKKGCTSYLQTKLVEPLVVEQVYELSFWIYFPEDSYVEDAIRDHIGFLPMLHRSSMSNNNMLNVHGFFGRRVPTNEWFQIKYYIRALCPLKYLLIGAFRSKSFPLVHRHSLDHYPFFFIDDVEIQSIDENIMDSTIIPTHFVSFTKKNLPVSILRSIKKPHYITRRMFFLLPPARRVNWIRLRV